MERRRFLKNVSVAGAGAALVGSGGPLHAETEYASPASPPQRAAGEVSAFCAAAAAGDVRALEELLNKDAALLYSRDQDGNSAYLLACFAGKNDVADLLERKGLVLDFHEAVAHSNGERIKELRAQSPDIVNLKNAFGDTPMHVATICQQSAVVGQVQWGSRFDIPNPKRKSMTAAHFAVQAPDEAAAEAMSWAIFGNGTGPELKTSEGDSCLHLAAAAGHVRVVHLLLRKGASVSAKNALGKTPLDVARENGRAGAMEELQRADCVQRDYYGKRFTYKRDRTPLQRDDRNGLPVAWINDFAIFSHFDLDRVKQMHAKSPELLNTRSTWDELPVEAGAHMGNVPICTFFLEQGAPYSICTAAMLGDTATVKAYLSEDKRRIHERGAHDFPLIWYPAFGHEQVETAEVLLAAGAKAGEDQRGRSALHIAAEKGQVKMAELLLAHGADPDQKGVGFSGEALTPIEAAEKSKHPELAAMLRKLPRHT